MEAAIVGLDMHDSYYEEFGAHYAHMKKIFTDGLKSIGIPFTDPQGAYFVLANIGPYTVSYTHLDVYKRQEWMAAIEKSVPAKFLDMNKKAFALGREA